MNSSYILAIMMLCAVALMTVVPYGVYGAAVVVDDGSLTYSPAEPLHTDIITVSAKVVASKAELGPGSVVLKHSLCTETYCALPDTAVMTLDNGSGLYKVTIGPFPVKDASDQPYLDIRFHVEATGTPTDGTVGSVKASSKEVTVYFKTSGPVDDDEDDDDENGSPFPLIALAPLALSPFVRLRRKRTH